MSNESTPETLSERLFVWLAYPFVYVICLGAAIISETPIYKGITYVLAWIGAILMVFVYSLPLIIPIAIVLYIVVHFIVKYW